MRGAGVITNSIRRFDRGFQTGDLTANQHVLNNAYQTASTASYAPLASGAASAHRVHRHTTSTPIFKTRNTPCRIAVRAEIKKSINFNKNRCRIAVRSTSRGVFQRRNMPFSRPILRLTHHCQLKTASLRGRCNLLFPYGTGRCNTTGLLEQMPRSHGSMSFGSNGPHRHKPTPLIPDRHSASVVRTREVKA